MDEVKNMCYGVAKLVEKMHVSTVHACKCHYCKIGRVVQWLHKDVYTVILFGV